MSDHKKDRCPDCNQIVDWVYERFNAMHEKKAWRRVGHSAPCGKSCAPAGATYIGDLHVGLDCPSCKSLTAGS